MILEKFRYSFQNVESVCHFTSYNNYFCYIMSHSNDMLCNRYKHCAKGIGGSIFLPSILPEF